MAACVSPLVRARHSSGRAAHCTRNVRVVIWLSQCECEIVSIWLSSMSTSIFNKMSLFYYGGRFAMLGSHRAGRFTPQQHWPSYDHHPHTSRPFINAIARLKANARSFNQRRYELQFSLNPFEYGFNSLHCYRAASRIHAVYPLRQGYTAYAHAREHASRSQGSSDMQANARIQHHAPAAPQLPINSKSRKKPNERTRQSHSPKTPHAASHRRHKFPRFQIPQKPALEN